MPEIKEMNAPAVVKTTDGIFYKLKNVAEFSEKPYDNEDAFFEKIKNDTSTNTLYYFKLGNGEIKVIDLTDDFYSAFVTDYYRDCADHRITNILCLWTGCNRLLVDG